MHEQVLMNWILQHPKDEENNDNFYLDIVLKISSNAILISHNICQ